MKQNILIIFLITVFFSAPYLLNPQKLTQKDNDLGRTYVPLFSFVKKTIIKDKEIPLWRGEQMMGESQIANPISSLLYPVNVIFLIFPINFAAAFYITLHIFLAALFALLLAKDFKFSNNASLAAAFFFAFTPKFLLHIASGHITMIAAFAYFPLLMLSVRKIIKNSHNFWIVTCSVSLALMFIVHPTVFYYSAIFVFFYAFYLIVKDDNIIRNKKLFIKKILLLLVIPIIFFGLSAITLLPQSEFAPISTRSQLTLEDVAQPIWNHTKLIYSLIFPYRIFANLDAESFLYFGSVVLIFSSIGLIRVSRKSKIIIAVTFTLVTIFVAGLSTPLFKVLYEAVPLLKYSRITTRLWFGPTLMAALLAAYGLDRLKNKKLIYLFIILFLIESFFIGYKKINSIPNLSYDDQNLYQFLSNDKDLFRVYCTSYCFNPQLLSKYNIQLLNGESPIQQTQFVTFLERAGNYNHQKFAVIFPPYQSWLNKNPPIPSSELLTKANVKYAASTYPINMKGFIYLNKFENLYLYKNNSFQKRISFIGSGDGIYTVSYKPNSISLAFPKSNIQRTIVISENYFPGWFAYIEGNKYKVEKYEDVFQKILIPPQADHVDIKYLPDSFLMGKTITLASIIFLTLYFLRTKTKKL